jgi:hypothetical protein
MYSRTVSVRKPNGKTYRYERIVKSKRVDGKPRQEVLAHLGRVADGLSAADRTEFIRVLRKWAGEPEARPAVPAADQRDPELGESRSYGDVVAIESAWEAVGLKTLLQGEARDSGHGFDLERAIFAMTANRLIDPRSKYGTADWLYRDVYLPTGSPLDADQLYSALTWLAERQEALELALYRALVASGRVDATAVFYDTSAVWFEGRGPEGLAERGRPKGTHPPNRRLILLGLIRSIDGWPIAHRVFPGNTADVTTVEPMLRDLVERFGIRRFIFVCDRGMISEEVIALFERLGVEYVIATKLRGDAEVRDRVLGRAGRFRELDRQLGVKEVWCEGRRYVVCRNQVEAEGDARRRDEIIETLTTKHLATRCSASTKRAKALVTHKTFGRYLKEHDGHLILDTAKVKADARYDGKWVLRTNTALPADEVARLYKKQSGVEKDFREIKSFIELRPVYHRLEPRVRAHVFICVLAKVVARELETRLHRTGFIGTSIEAVLEELGRLQVTEVGAGDDRRFIRARLHPAQHDLLRRLAIDADALPWRLPAYPLARPRRVKLDNVKAEVQRQRRKQARHQAWLAEKAAPVPPPDEHPAS